MSTSNDFLREVVTGLISLVIILTAAIELVRSGVTSSPLLDTLCGAVVSFYFTRGGVAARTRGSDSSAATPSSGSNGNGNGEAVK